jgi:hypothetical protein
MGYKPLVEYRKGLGAEEQKRYSKNFRGIEGMEERKQRVLKECREKK